MSDEIMKPSEITEHFTIPNVRGTSTTNRAGYEAYLQARAQRKSVGRYTLEEAAMAIAEASGARADEMLDKFMNAAGEGALPTYEPGKDSRYIYDEGFASGVRDFYEEAYWDDLNDWIERTETRIIWRFPAPAPENGGAGGTSGDAPALQKETAKAKPATQEEIIAAFPIEGGWGDRLKKAPSGTYRWLEGTWARVGSKRPGDATTYRPVQIAIALAATKRMSISACDLAIKTHFPESWDEWEIKSAVLR